MGLTTDGLAMMSVGLEEVETYFLNCHNTATQYIMTCLILELCMVAKQRPERG